MQLDPEIADMLDQARGSTGKGVGDLTLDAGRAAYGQRYLARGLPHLPEVDVTRIEIPGPGGGIPARLYHAPDPAPSRPVAIYFHGGGFVLGDADAYDNQSRQLAQRSGVDVLFVDYRRAPEAKFPCAVEDAIAALDWLRDHAASLGLDPARIALCGDSAGGNLAISAALAADRAGQPVKAAVLLYPVTDFRPFTTGGGPEYPSISAFGAGYFLDEGLMRFFGDLYLRSPQDGLDPRASPLLASDLARMPPHVVITAGHDPLRDQGYAFHLAARAAGAASDYICHDGMIHNFMGHGGVSPGAAAAFAAVAEELGRRLG